MAALRASQRQALGGLKTRSKTSLIGRRACVVRAQPEEGPSTSENNTIFYGGSSYTESEWNAAVQSGTAGRPVVPPGSVAVAATPSIIDVMAFSGPGPEVINGRLAMLGFVSAVAAEFASGDSVLKQWASEPTGIAFAFIVFMGASLVPLLTPSNGQNQELGPFTAKAEMLNGRAAMIGFAALIIIELVKGSPLF